MIAVGMSRASNPAVPRGTTRARVTAGAIAKHYGGLLAGLVVERGDEASASAEEGAPAVLASDTIMKSRADSLRLAREVLAFAESLRR